MSVKKATVVTVTALITFIIVAAGIGSVGAGGKKMIEKDGYGISTVLR